MKFIRAFWGDLNGNSEQYINEIKNAAKNKSLNEIIYVWGDFNYLFIKSFGYNCIKVSSNNYETKKTNLLDGVGFFIHKYIAIKLAVEEFGECIFLDWDVNQIKSVDDNFYELLKKQNKSIQLPVYTFPKNDYMDYILMRWPKMPKNMKEFSHKHYECNKKYGYEFDDDFVVPCTCFVYCSNIEPIDDFIKLSTEQDSYSEEGIWAEWDRLKGGTLHSWIQNYEPLVCNAKYDWHFNQKKLNNYISTIIKKDLYFIHQ